MLVFYAYNDLFSFHAFIVFVLIYFLRIFSQVHSVKWLVDLCFWSPDDAFKNAPL